MKTKKFQPFRKVCVIGSGLMGSGIAAHLANAGISTLMLDIAPKGAKTEAEKNVIVKKGLASALKIKPNAFFSRADASLIEVGNLEDDLEKIRGCDWVIEVVLEKLEVKQQLFSKIEPFLAEGAVVSSNTSGLSIDGMLEGRSETFAQNFLVTHFFNPVRYMHLLEVVSAPTTDPEVLERVVAFGEDVLGKGIVFGKDTPNFVANRVGVYAMMETMRQMQAGKYTVEEVDAVFGPATGRPKSAVFRTADVVGLDTFAHVAQNCHDNLSSDEMHEVFALPQFLKDMLKNGWLGQKSGQGFYKKVGKEIQALNLSDLTYHTKEKVRYDSLGRIRNMEAVGEKTKALAFADDKAGKLAWAVLSRTCVYAANRLGEIADDIVQIDNAMKWGFGWDLGPFETWDALGVKESVAKMHHENMPVPAWVSRMLEAGRNSFYETDARGMQTFWDAKTNAPKVLARSAKEKKFTFIKADKNNVVAETMATALVDMGDGVLACEFLTKMNAIDNEVIDDINAGLDRCEAGEFNSLILANDGQNFSVGANIMLILMAAQSQQWDQIDQIVKAFQDLGKRLKYSSVPTVAAPFNMTLGGGAEVSLWCNRIRASAELYMGLVEVGVGLIPGGGGNIEMLARNLEGAVDDPNFNTDQLVRRALETVAMAKVSMSAFEAKELFYLAPSDSITLNRRYHLEAAKQEALGMANSGFVPPRKRTYRLGGKNSYATFEMALQAMRDGNFISDHDLKIGKKVAHVMTGGDCTPREPVTEQYLLDLEREAFLSLCGEEKTMERIMFMLQNNKPLRN